jgi:hypothetical protein
VNAVEITIVLLIVGLGWLWYDSMRAREAGIRAVRAACAAEGLQPLDETIAIARMRPRRDRSGQLCWLRVYQFEYSDTGDNRRPGSVHLLGQDVTFLSLGLRPVPGAGVSPSPRNSTEGA